MSEIKIGEYISRKEYLKKYDSNVGYALHIQNNIKRDDYARLNTGQIVKVIEIKENNVNKKAIYYGIYYTDWFDSTAVENFSNEIINLIENGDILRYRINNLCATKIGEVKKYKDARSLKVYLGVEGFSLEQIEILGIAPKEQFKNIEYKVVE